MSTATSEVTRGQRSRWTIGVVLMLFPMLVLTFVPTFSGAGGLINVAILTAVAGFGVASIVGIASAVMAPALMLFGLYASGTPWLGTVLMIVVSVGVAWSVRRGMQIAATLVAAQLAMALILAPFVGGAASDPDSAKIVAGLAAFGSLWGALIGSVFIHGQPRRTPDMDGVPRSWDRAIAMAVLVGITTALGMTMLAQTSVWWAVLVIFVVLLPYEGESQIQMVTRTGVTIGLALFAALVALVLPFPAFTTLVGILVLVLAVASYLRQRPWVFMALLTVAVIFLGFDPQIAVGAPSQQIAAAVVGALALLVTTLIAQLGLARRGTLTAA